VSFERVTSQQRRQRTLEALPAQIKALAQQSPVLMIFEDAHWGDPTSLEALGRAVDRIRTLGVLLIVTHRPEFEAPWIGRPHVIALTLNRLARREIRRDGTTEPYTAMQMSKVIRKLRDRLALPSTFTLDACRHGGMTELEEAELTR
jgi:hypothetical protein